MNLDNKAWERWNKECNISPLLDNVPKDCIRLVERLQKIAFVAGFRESYCLYWKKLREKS